MFWGLFFVSGSIPHPFYEGQSKTHVWPIFSRGIFPLQAVLDDIDNATDNVLVINPRDSVRVRKIAFNPGNLVAGKMKNIRGRYIIDLGLAMGSSNSKGRSETLCLGRKVTLQENNAIFV